MKNIEVKSELLAPAGDWNSLIAAVNAGADAVYLAGRAYGARAYAKNFSTEELLNAIDYLHLFDKKIYLTINTLNKEEELETLPEFLAPFYDRGLDGVIVQDLGAVRLLKECFPGLELHASTQMTVTGPKGAKLLQEYGLERVVPARELSLRELIAIKESGIEVEAFIHGAMCYCYSGQCLMSSMLGGRSGNRGRCAGPCRLPFTAFDGCKLSDDNNYVLSLKDLCTIENLQSILEAGIDSLKIEGRMKSPEYVAYVTSLYRKYIDIYNKKGNIKVEKKDLDTLRKLFVRGDICNGYLYRKNSRDMVTLTKPGYNGSDDKLMKELFEKYVSKARSYPVSVYAYISIGEELRVTISDGEICGEAVGNLVVAAQNRPADEASVSQKLAKLGGTNLEACDIDVFINGNCFVNVKELNECRRQAAEDFLNKKLNRFRRKSKPFQALAFGKEKSMDCSIDSKDKKLSILVRTKEQLAALDSINSSIRVCIEADLLLDMDDNNSLTILEGLDKKQSIYLALPRIIRLEDDKYLDRIHRLIKGKVKADGLIIRNLEELAWAIEIKKEDGLSSIRLLADHNMYSFNNYAIGWYEEFGLDITLPLELNKDELSNLHSSGAEMVVYGRTPLMVTAGCVKNTLEGCDKVSRFLSLTDRTNTDFLIYKDCRRCENLIYNSLPTSLHQFSNSIKRLNLSCLRLEFVDENAKQVKEVINTFNKAFDLKMDADFPVDMCSDISDGKYTENNINHNDKDNDYNISKKNKSNNSISNNLVSCSNYMFTKGYFKRGVD